MSTKLTYIDNGREYIRRIASGGGLDFTINAAGDIEIATSASGTFDDLVVNGDLTINGTTTTVDTVNTTIQDNIIELNSGESGAGVTLSTSGFEIDRGTEDNVSLLWDDAVDSWTFGGELLSGVADPTSDGHVGDRGYNDARYAAISHVGSGGTAHAVATTSSAGFMSSTDKSKLDAIDSGAEANAVDSVNGATGTVVLDGGDIDSTHTATNYTAANATLDGHLSGIDDVIETSSLMTVSLSTSLTSGGEVSATPGETTFDITAGSGIIVDDTDPENVVINDVSWAESTDVAVTNVVAANVTYVGVNTAGAIVQQTTFPTPQERRSVIFLATITHAGTTITDVRNSAIAIKNQVSQQIADFMLGLGPITTGVDFSANGANLEIDRTSGTILAYGSNFQTNPQDPHTTTIASETGSQFVYAWRDGSGDFETILATTIDPNSYDNNAGGASEPAGSVANNSWTNQYIFVTVGGLTIVLYGQNVYGSKEAAANAVGKESLEISNRLRSTALRAVLTVRGNATDLSNSDQAQFTPVGRISSVTSLSSAISVASLQSAYNVSTQPEILTNSVLGAITIRRGSAADTDNVLEIQNNAGTNTASIDGNGKLTVADIINAPNLPEYADDASAGSGGLVTGDVYRTVTGELRIKL